VDDHRGAGQAPAVTFVHIQQGRVKLEVVDAGGRMLEHLLDGSGAQAADEQDALRVRVLEHREVDQQVSRGHGLGVGGWDAVDEEDLPMLAVPGHHDVALWSFSVLDESVTPPAHGKSGAVQRPRTEQRRAGGGEQYAEQSPPRGASAVGE
jgi:hypothetical protein